MAKVLYRKNEKWSAIQVTLQKISELPKALEAKFAKVEGTVDVVDVDSEFTPQGIVCTVYYAVI